MERGDRETVPERDEGRGRAKEERKGIEGRTPNLVPHVETTRYTAP